MVPERAFWNRITLVYLEAMNIPDSISDHDGPSVGCDGNRQGRTLQRYDRSADAIVEVPEPERAVVRAREGMPPVGAYRDRAHRARVLGEGMQELAGSEVPEPKGAVRGSGKRMRSSGATATA